MLESVVDIGSTRGAVRVLTRNGIIAAMSEYGSVSLPEALLQRAKKLARARHRPVEVVIAELLDGVLPVAEEPAVSETTEDAAVRREMEAYVALHPTLKADYYGQHVAILDGRLVDHDADPATLYERIATRYPDRFVWLTAVEDEPLTTLVFRSPRIAPER